MNRNGHTKLSIELVRQLFPKYVHSPGDTMFSMGRALIGTLRYLSCSSMNLKEIELNGLRIFSSAHFDDVIEVVFVEISRKTFFRNRKCLLSNFLATSTC